MYEYTVFESVVLYYNVDEQFLRLSIFSFKQTVNDVVCGLYITQTNL